MGTFSIKEVRTIKKVDRLSKMIHKHFIYLTSKPELQHTTQELVRLLTDQNMITYFVYDSKIIVAYLVGEVKHLNDGRIVYYVSYIYVAPTYRSKKLGSWLLKSAIQSVQSSGIKYVLLTSDVTDEKLVHFYQKFGFTVDPILKNGSRHEVFVLNL